MTSSLIGSLSPSGVDRAQYFSVNSSRRRFSGVTLHSTCRLVLDVPLYAPVAMRSAVAWMVSSFSSSVLDADAYAWQP